MYWFKKNLPTILSLLIATGCLADNSSQRAAENCGVKQCSAIIKDMKKFARNGSAHAQAVLGLLYMSGIGTEVDQDLGVKYMKKAARNGLAYAQYDIGLLYQFGHILDKDEDEAKEWLNRAAESGYEPAIKLLQHLNNQDLAPAQKSQILTELLSADKKAANHHDQQSSLTLSDFSDFIKLQGYGNSRQTGSRIKGKGCSNSASSCESYRMNSALGRSRFDSLINKINIIHTQISSLARSVQHDFIPGRREPS